MNDALLLTLSTCRKRVLRLVAKESPCPWSSWSRTSLWSTWKGERDAPLRAGGHCRAQAIKDKRNKLLQEQGMHRVLVAWLGAFLVGEIIVESVYRNYSYQRTLIAGRTCPLTYPTPQTPSHIQNTCYFLQWDSTEAPIDQPVLWILLSWLKEWWLLWSKEQLGWNRCCGEEEGVKGMICLVG